MLQIQSKRFYLDVKQNLRGRFIKVAEVSTSRDQISNFNEKSTKKNNQFPSLFDMECKFHAISCNPIHTLTHRLEPMEGAVKYFQHYLLLPNFVIIYRHSVISTRPWVCQVNTPFDIIVKGPAAFNKIQLTDFFALQFNLCVHRPSKSRKCSGRW